MNILDTIVAQKQREIISLPSRPIPTAGARRDFAGALRNPRRGTVGLIAEVKKASPSAGVICADFDPVRIAREYEAAGADCLSVLTDEKFFQGSLAYLRAIRQAVALPLLRKDFIIDERQIAESIENGADAILLIVRILDDARLRRFHEIGREAGIAVLVETHDEAEMDRARAIGADLIGVNNRNLDTFTVDLGVTGRLAAKAPAGAILVAESGIHTRADVQRVERDGAKAILVGESLMRNSGGISAKVAELLNAN
jgi:indole-3-glycerol phosphate synthase